MIRKITLSLLSYIIVATLAATAFVGCSSSDEMDSEPPPVESTDPNADMETTPQAEAVPGENEEPTTEVAAQDDSQEPLLQLSEDMPMEQENSFGMLPETGTHMPYVVEVNDTLKKIKQKIYKNSINQELFTASMEKVNKIAIGDVVYYQLSADSTDFSMDYLQRTPMSYHVKSGDTLSQIAKDIYGTGKAWKMLWRYSDIVNPDRIYVGQKIVYYAMGYVQQEVDSNEEDAENDEETISLSEVKEQKNPLTSPEDLLAEVLDESFASIKNQLKDRIDPLPSTIEELAKYNEDDMPEDFLTQLKNVKTNSDDVALNDQD